MTWKVFIDGGAGTTGLQIRQRLASRRELVLLSIDSHQRKADDVRRAMINAADLAILCLPDAAARRAVAMIDNPAVKVIDASTAHRTSPGWVYGFPEIGLRAQIAVGRYVANPGCYATGFIALARPLVACGLIPAGWPFSVNAVSGYSGGGRAMIEEFEASNSERFTSAPFRAYALDLGHKHVLEMRTYAGLTHPPLFTPSVGRFFNGMMVEVPLPLHLLPGHPRLADLRVELQAAYGQEPFIEVVSDKVVTIEPTSLNQSNRLQLHVRGSDALGQARLIAVLDNLGKGAAGAAVQNLNLMLGLEETAGL